MNQGGIAAARYMQARLATDCSKVFPQRFGSTVWLTLWSTSLVKWRETRQHRFPVRLMYYRLQGCLEDFVGCGHWSLDDSIYGTTHT